LGEDVPACRGGHPGYWRMGRVQLLVAMRGVEGREVDKGREYCELMHRKLQLALGSALGPRDGKGGVFK